MMIHTQYLLPYWWYLLPGTECTGILLLNYLVPPGPRTRTGILQPFPIYVVNDEYVL